MESSTSVKALLFCSTRKFFPCYGQHGENVRRDEVGLEMWLKVMEFFSRTYESEDGEDKMLHA